MKVRPDHRARTLRAQTFQVLWALLLVYLVLSGIAVIFGREIGYCLSFGVCLGLAVLVTTAFFAIHVLDRTSAAVSHCFAQRKQRGGYMQKKKIIIAPDAPNAIGPYSQAVEANGFVFVSGQIPLDAATGSVLTGTVREQTQRVLENAKAILAAAGCGMERIVKTTIYLKDMNDFGAVNEVYGGYFPSDPPARATVEVSRLPKDVAIEIDFVAIK